MNPPQLSVEKLLTFFGPPVLLTAFGIIVIAFIAISGVLFFHWKSYGFNPKRVHQMLSIYFIVSGFLLLSMIFSLFYYFT